MAKYNDTIVKECEAWIAKHGLMEYGGAMMKEFCAHFAIDYKTYKIWLKKDKFREAVERGKETFKVCLTHDLSVSLAEAAKGGEYTKTKKHKEYRPNADGTRGQLVKLVEDEEKGYNAPNVGAAIFLLTNLDPEHYQNRQKNDITLKKDEDKPMTLDEINAEIERLEKLEK